MPTESDPAPVTSTVDSPGVAAASRSVPITVGPVSVAGESVVKHASDATPWPGPVAGSLSGVPEPADNEHVQPAPSAPSLKSGCR